MDHGGFLLAVALAILATMMLIASEKCAETARVMEAPYSFSFFHGCVRDEK